MSVVMYTLEEEAARRDAVGLASKPDLAPLSAVSPLIGPGMLQPAAGLESTLYLPVERQEQVALSNLAVAFGRLDVDSATAEETPIVTDVTVVLSVGSEPPVMVDLGPLYTRIEVDLLASGDDASAEHAYLCVKTEKANACTEAPIVDLAVVYGGAADSEGGFEMGGGFDTVELPPCLAAAYGCKIYMCLKREGAGSAFAEQLAARAAAEAASAMDAESTFHEGSQSHAGAGDAANDLDDELLDTSLSPDEIRDLEAKRARDMRERALRAEAEAEESRREAYSAELRRELNDALDRRDALKVRNKDLSGTVFLVLKKQSQADDARGAKGSSAVGEMSSLEAEKAYGDTLNGVVEVEERHRVMVHDFTKITRDLQSRLDEKEAKAADIYETFRAFKAQIALQAQHSRSGKGLPKAEVERLRNEEQAKDDEAGRVRLRNINLRLTLRKLEASLKAKEQLAEGLHMVDFEQLKIENGSLVEKIEERGAELHKLKQKKTAAVEVLSHVKEKLHFTKQQASNASKTLAQLERDVAEQRDKLAQHKRARTALQRRNAGHATDQGFTKSHRLVMDFEQRKKATVAVKEKIEETKEKFENLSRFVKANS